MARTKTDEEVLVLSVPAAGKRLGLGRGASYQAAKRGELPVLKLGHKLVVSKIALERMLENAGR
jgi:hypothetical protein